MEIIAKNKNEFQNLVLHIPNGTKTIENGAFSECNWFNIVVIPEGVEKIGESAFSFCKNLEKVHFPSTLLEIGISSFTGCLKLEKLLLKNVRVIGPNAFARCKNLTDVDMPRVEAIYYRAFYMCRKLQSITNATNVQYVRKEAFAHAGKISFIKFGEPLLSIDNGAFKYSQVHLVSLEEATQLKSMGNSIFQNCELLSGVKFAPQTQMKILCTKIFRNCSNLHRIELPEGITAISSNVFESSSIREVTCPSTLNKIARRAFYNCSEFCMPVLSVDVAVDPTAFLGCRPTSVFDLSNTITHMELDDKLCSICMEGFANNSCKFGCGHVFHTECAKEWYVKSSTCANCRQEVEQVQVVEKSVKRRKICK